MSLSSISVIVPVFNVGKYLPCCIESVLNQSFPAFELILIDDGSTDGCSGLCDSYAREDSRIRVFHKKNGGVSSARNVGLDNARGEWVFFLDSDDLLPDRALEMLISCVDRDVDMVYGGIRKFAETDESVETINVTKEGEISIEDALDAFIAPEQRRGDWQRYLGNRLYRLSTINKFPLRFFTDIHYKEDGLFVVQYLCRCENKVFCIPDVVYLYRQTAGGAMGSLAKKYNERLLTNVDSHGFIYQELKKRGVSKDLLQRELNEIFGNYDWISRVMKRSGAFNTKNKRHLLKRVIKNAGLVRTFYHLVVLRYGRKIKRKFL